MDGILASSTPGGVGGFVLCLHLLAQFHCIIPCVGHSSFLFQPFDWFTFPTQCGLCFPTMSFDYCFNRSIQCGFEYKVFAAMSASGICESAIQHFQCFVLARVGTQSFMKATSISFLSFEMDSPYSVFLLSSCLEIAGSVENRF